VLRSTGQHVVSSAAAELVLAFPSVEAIVARSSADLVVAGPAHHPAPPPARVVARACLDLVVPGARV
jgi:hypothetical protein